MSEIFIKKLGIAGIVCIVLLSWLISNNRFFENAEKKDEVQLEKCEAEVRRLQRKQEKQDSIAEAANAELKNFILNKTTK